MQAFIIVFPDVILYNAKIRTAKTPLQLSELHLNTGERTKYFQSPGQKLYWKERIFLHRKKVQHLQNWFGTQTWPHWGHR